MKKLVTRSGLLLFTVFILISFNTAAETIVSAQDGNWKDGPTWAGGVVPTSSDSVVVHHIIDIYNLDSCLHLYVSSSGTIQNKVNSSRILVVKGNLYVDGTATYTNNFFYIKLGGNLHLNGIWSSPRVVFTGSANQVVSASPGKVFTATRTGIIFEDADPASPISFASSLEFSEIELSFSGATLVFMPGILVKVSTKPFRDSNIIGNNSSLQLSNGAYINNCSLENLTLKGVFNIGFGNTTTGEIIVADTLQNLINASRTLDVNGNFTNNGVIQITNNYLQFTFSGNVANNGKWTCGNISLDGASQQFLSCGEGKYFYCNNFTDTDPGSPIHLLEDTEIRKASVDLGGTTLDAENYRFVLRDNAYIKNSVLNNAHLGGIFRVYTPQVTFTGITVVDDTLQNAPYTTNPTVLFEGLLINNGTINRSNNYGLHMLIAGNLENNAAINSEYVVFSGTSDQILTSTAKGNIIETDNFDDMDEGSKIIVSSTLTLINAVADLNGAIMELDNANLFLSGGQFEDGTIEAQGNEISQSNAGSFESIHIKSASLKGKCMVYGSANIFEDTFVEDTLQNYPITINPVLTVRGNFVNNGVVGKSNTYRIFLKVEDNFDNEGPCELYQLNFTGSGDQSFKSPVYPVFNTDITSSKTSGNLLFDGDVFLQECILDFDDHVLQIAENQTLFLDNTHMSHVIVNGGENSVLNFSNGSYFNYSTINDCLFAGVVEISSNVNLNDCIIDGLFQNRVVTYSPTITIGGTTLNDGVIINNPATSYKISTDIKGHVYNDGIWRVKENDWNGTMDQDIYLLNNKNIGTESIFTSDVQGASYQWSRNGIPIPEGVHRTYELDSITPAERGYFQCIADGSPSRIIRVCTPVEIDLAAEAWFCQYETVTLEPEITFGEPPYTWSWSPVEGLSDPNIQNPLANPQIPTLYTLTVTDAIGCKGETNIFVQQYPQLYASAGMDKEMCAGASTMLNGNAYGGVPEYNYAWTPEAGLNNPNIAHPIASPSQTTLYTLTVTDENGCAETDNVTVTVHPLPEAFSFSQDSTHFCYGQDTIITWLLGSEVGVDYYLLVNGSPNPGGEVFPGTGEPITIWATTTVQGQYTVKGVNTATGCENMMIGSVMIFIDFLPEVVDQSGDEIVIEGENTTLWVEATSTQPPWLQWYKDEVLIPGAEDYMLVLENVSLDATGTYQCLVTNNCDIAWSDPVSITVLQRQTIEIPAGWSGFSTYQDVFDADVNNMFDPLDGNLVIVSDFENVFWPGGAVNTYGDWNTKVGAQIKLSESASLYVDGLLPDDRTLNLAAGWHYLPVLSPCVIEAPDIFNQLGASLDLAKDIAGTRVYWPEFNIQTLNILEPGKSYLIKLNTASTLTFPDCLKGDQTAPSSNRAVNGSPWTDPTYTGTSHLIVIPELLCKSILQSDAWIGVFNQNGICAGLSEYKQGSLVLTAFADDATTIEVDGLAANEAFKLRVYNPVSGQYVELSALYSADYDEGYFVANGVSVVDDLKTARIQNGTGKAEISIYPNPAHEVINIHGIQASVRWEIINVSGETVKAGVTDENLQILRENLTSGLYTLKLVLDSEVICRKVIFN